MNRTLFLVCASAILVIGCRSETPAAAAPVDTAGARAFVVNFYRWYWKPDSTKNVDSVMARHHEWLAADLAAMVDSDNACAGRAHGECRLEEDPFLASQDPCQRYEVGGALAHGDTIGVSIFGVCDGKRDTVPTVIAMVVAHDSGWQFANFVYPAERTDLHTMLARSSIQSMRAPATRDADPASRAFVAAFYDWYVPKALAPRGTFWVALRERPTVFSDSLRRWLALDTLIQSQAEGEIDGVDWDPYLASQDPCERYEVGNDSRVDSVTDAVEVHAVCGGKRTESPVVVAIVRAVGSGHRFIDFRTPGDSLGLIDHIILLHPGKHIR